MTLTLGMIASSLQLPVFINANSGASSASASSISYTHTTTANTSLLVVGAFCQNNGNSITVSSITFNGVVMTQLQESSASNGCGAVFYLFNPPIGSYTIVVTPTGTADRGIAAQSMNIGNARAINVSGLANDNSTDPRTLTITSTQRGLAIGHVKVTGLNGSTINTSSSSPTGMITAVAPRQFLSNGFAKYNSIWYSPNYVPAGSTSFTNTMTSGSISARSLIYAIVT